MNWRTWSEREATSLPNSFRPLSIAPWARLPGDCTNWSDITGPQFEALMKTLADQMAAYAVGLRFDELPAPVVHEVKRRVIDSLGCALGAWEAEPCQIARRVASRFSAERGATLLGLTQRAPPDWAAVANGCLVRY